MVTPTISRARKQKPTPRAFEPLSVAEATERHDFRTPLGNKRVSPWYRFCLFQEGFYEYPTREFVAGLGEYISARAAQIKDQQQERVRILEVAAGSGRFSALLGAQLEAHGQDVDIRAADNRSWSENARKSYSPHVAKQDYKAAIADHRPHIILAAWVPTRNSRTGRVEDWTPTFRQQPETEEYILIGSDGDQERHAAPASWGFTHNPYGPDIPADIPEYEADGFSRINLDHLREAQLCYISTTADMHPSRTVVFRRDEAQL